MIFSDLPTCDTFAVGSVGCCSWQGQEGLQRGALEHEDPVLPKPWTGPSWVHQRWRQRCPTGDLSHASFNVPAWTLALGSHCTEKKMCIWLWVERSAWAIFSNLKKRVWFDLFVAQKSGTQGGRENPCSLWLCSSNLGAIWNYCAHANATTWAWAWPCSVLANCWVFLHVRSCVWAWSISWVREKTEAVPCWLRGSVGELSGTGLGFNWHLTKPCLGWSPAVAPWSSAAFSALAHHGRHLAVKEEPPEWGVSPAAPFYSSPLTTGGWTDCTDCGSQLHLWEIPRRERVSPGSSVLLFYCIPAGICLMWTECSKFSKYISEHQMALKVWKIWKSVTLQEHFRHVAELTGQVNDEQIFFTVVGHSPLSVSLGLEFYCMKRD